MLRRSGGLQEVLAATGYTGLDDQYQIKGSIGDIPFSGKADLVLWKNDRASAVIDIKRSSGNSGVDYIYQIAAYAKGLQQSNLLMNTGAKIGTASVLPGHANDLMTRFFNAPSEADQVSVAKEALKSIISGTSGTHLDMKDVPANSEFIPGGKIYQGFKSVADEMITVNKITGESPQTLARQPIPSGFEQKYATLYDAVIAATQAVMAGSVTVEQARSYIQNRSQGLPLNTSAVKPIVYDTTKIGGSNLYGDTRVGWGHPVQNPALGMAGMEQGGTVKVPAGTPGLWTQPSAFTGDIAQFGTRPVLNSTVITKVQNPNDLQDIFEPGVLDKLANTFKSVGGGAYGAREVARTLREITQGMPQLSKDWRYTMTAAAQAMLEKSVAIFSDVSTQEWYAKSGDLVRRGGDPSIAFPISETISAVLGNVVQGGVAYTGESSPEKVEKRLQQALRKTDMLSAPPESGRNIASPFRMAGATRREFGMRFKMAVANVLPEGMGAIDAGTVRQMGGMVDRFTRDIPIPAGVTFQRVDPYYNAVGEYIVGKAGGTEVPLDTSDWAGVRATTEVVIENGQQILRVRGMGTVDPNADAAKSWLANKAMTPGFEGLKQAVVGAGTVEGIMPMFKNVRQGVGVILSGRYGGGQAGMNVLIRQLKARGVDVDKLIEQTSTEERGMAGELGVNLPRQRLVWGTDTKMDEAALDIANQVMKSKFHGVGPDDKPMSFTDTMSYETYLTIKAGIGRVLGPESVRVDDPASWAVNRDERRSVTLTVPMAVTNLMQQYGMEYRGTARMTYEEITDLLRNPGQYDDKYAQAILGNVFPNLAELSGHKRQYYESILKATVGSRSGAMGGNLPTISIDELAEAMKGVEGDFVTKLRESAKGRYIDVGGGKLLPPGDIMSIMSVESPLKQMMGNKEMETPLPYEQHNAIINLLDKMTKSEPGAYRDKLRAALTGKFDDLTSAEAVIKGLLSLDVTGSGGTESPYTAHPALRPWETLLGRTAMQDLFGPKGANTAMEAIRKGFSAVSLFIRRPISDPTAGITPLRIQTRESLMAMGVTSIPEEYRGQAVAMTLMDKPQGDFDADRGAQFLASEYKNGTLFTKAGIADAATEKAWLDNAFYSLGKKLGQEIEGPRTFQGYLDAVMSLGDRGMKISELWKSINELSQQPTSPEKFLDVNKYRHGLDIQGEVRPGYMGAEIAKQAKGPIYNLFNRNLGVISKFFGSAYEEAEGRARYYGQQASLDITELSEGLRALIGIAHTYTVTADPNDVTGGRGRKGWITDKLTMKMGTLASREVAWKDLPNEIIKAALSSTELQGFGGLNASFAQDIGQMLSTDPGRAADIAKLIMAGGDTESLTTSIRGLYGSVGDFWKSGGPLVAMLGSHMMKRGLNARGVPNEIAQSLTKDEGFTSFAGGVPSGGMGLFALLKDPMMAMQNIMGGKSGQQGRGPRGLLEDLATAGAAAFSNSKMGELMGAFNENMKKSIREVIGSVQGYFAGGKVPGGIGDIGGIVHGGETVIPAGIDLIDRWEDFKEGGGNKRDFAALYGLSTSAMSSRVSRATKKFAPEYLAQRRMDLMVTQAQVAGVQSNPANAETSILARLQAMGINPVAEPAGQAEANAAIESLIPQREIPQSTRTPGGTGRSGGRQGGTPIADLMTERAWYSPAGSSIAFMMGERSPEGNVIAKRGAEYGSLLQSVYAGERGLPSEAEALKMQQEGKLHKGGVSALRAARKGSASGISGELEFLGKQGMLSGNEEGQPGLGDMFKAIADRTAQLDKFGGAIDLVTKNIGKMDDGLSNVNKVLGRYGQDIQGMKPNEAFQQQVLGGALGQLQGVAPEVIAERLRLTGQGGQFGAVKSAIEQFGQLTQADIESRAAGEGPLAPQKSRGLGGMARGLFAGDLGPMAWGLFNVQRAWRYTGGPIAADVQQYAAYEAQQQQAVAQMGGPSGFYGAPGDIMAAQGAVKQFGLGVGSAAWRMISPAAKLMGSLGGGNPEQPGALDYGLSIAGMGTGAALTTGLAGNLAAKYGASTGIQGLASAGALVQGAGPYLLAGTGLTLASGALYGGVYKAAQAAGLTSETTGFAQFMAQAIASPFESRFGTGFRQAFGMEQGQMTAGLTGIATRTFNPEQTAQMAEYMQYAKLGTGLEKAVPQLQPGQGAQMYGAVAQATGMDLAGLQGVDLTGFAKLPQAMQGERATLAIQMARMSGAQWGSAGMGAYLEQAVGATPGQTLRAQEAQQRLSPLAEIMRTYGGGMQGMNIGTLSAMTPYQQNQYAGLGSGDTTSWNRFIGAMQSGRTTTFGTGGGDLGIGRQAFTGVTGYEMISPQMGQQMLDVQMRASLPQAAMTLANRTYQDIQLQTQDAGFMRNTQYMTGYTGVTGMRGLQNYYNPNRGDPRFAAQMGPAFGPTSDSMWGLQDQQVAEDYRHNLAGIGIQGGQIALADRQWKEQRAITDPYFHLQYGNQATGQLGWMQRDRQMQNERTLTQLNWQQADLGRNFGQQMTQFDWSGADLSRQFGRQTTQFGWQAADLATGFARSQTQFGWQARGMERQGAMSGMQFGWQMEDIGEAMRYATGREKRQLGRQAERAAISYGFGQEGLDEEKKQLEERRKWGLEDFTKDKERLSNRRSWAQEDYNTESSRLGTRRKWAEEEYKIEDSRFDTRRKWLLTDIDLDKEKMDAEIEYRTQLHDLEEKQHAESVAMQMASVGEAATHLKNMKAIDDQIRDLQRANQAADLLAQTQTLTDQITHMKNLREIEDKANAVDAITVAWLNDLAKNLGPKEAGGRIAMAFDAALTQMEQKIRTSLAGGD